MEQIKRKKNGLNTPNFIKVYFIKSRMDCIVFVIPSAAEIYGDHFESNLVMRVCCTRGPGK